MDWRVFEGGVDGNSGAWEKGFVSKKNKKLVGFLDGGVGFLRAKLLWKGGLMKRKKFFGGDLLSLWNGEHFLVFLGGTWFGRGSWACF